MTASRPTSQRAKKGRSRTVRSRTFSGALGGVLGVVAMSAIAGVLVTASVVPVVALTSRAADSTIDIFNNMPEYLAIGELAQPSTLYAKDSAGNNVPFATFYDQDRVEKSYDEISPFVKDAVVAVEDPRFFDHGGVDLIAMTRSLVRNAAGNQLSGASTITMQYVKNVLVQQAEAIPDEEESKEAYKNATRTDADRKLKEMKLAIGIEKEYGKDEILQGYLNIALFGRKIYGIESAAQYYYSTTAADLTLAQAASLVAIVNNPSKLQIDIPENIPANTARRDRILGDMLDHQKITQAQYDEAIATEVVPVIKIKDSGCGASGGLAFFCDFVSRTIKNDPSFGNSAAERWFKFQRGGLNIYTTIDLDMQTAAQDAMAANVPATMDGIDVGSTAVSTEVGTGRVLAMTQNRPFAENDEFIQANPGYTAINYNTDFEYGGSSGFQVGSTYKAFTLAEWIRTGHSLNEIVNTSGRTVDMKTFKDRCKADGVAGFEMFTFKNASSMGGNRTALAAMAQSLNGGFISMAQKMDVCDITDLAEKMGVHRAADRPVDNPDYDKGRHLTGNLASVFGGTDEVAPITMSLAYGGFLGDGKVCTPTPIDSITNVAGEDQPFTKATCTQAIEPRVAAGVAYALQYDVTNGIAPHARSSIGIPHGAKTGTTDFSVDNWTVGGSTRVSTAVWTGNVTGKVETTQFGLDSAGKRIWPAVMDAADAKYGGEAFPTADSTVLVAKTTPIPATAGKSFEETKALLESLGFTATDGGIEDSNQPNGTVSRTDPAAGAAAVAGSNIVIYRSNASMLTVPEVSGSYSDIVQALRNAGFTTTPKASCESGSGTVPKDENKRKVVGSSPAAGEMSKKDGQITLLVECS